MAAYFWKSSSSEVAILPPTGRLSRPMPKKYDDKMSLDMPYGEALERFIGTDPEEVRANIAKSKAAKPAAERKRPAAKPDQANVTKLASKRKP
jgi:hypothetical protein